MDKIAYLGDKYTHTYAAAECFKKPGDTLTGYNTVYDSIKAAADGKCDYVIAPVENSCGGSVDETLDALRNLPVFICGEVVIKVPQSLIGVTGARKEDIRVIYSHPQAIAQSIEYLRANFVPADVIAVKSTAQALSMVNEKHIAAIARKPAGGQEIIEAEIEDVKNNSTRFLKISGSAGLAGEKCSVFFEVMDKPGALLDVLDVFRRYGLNMTRLESRPHKSKLGRYVFFVDFMSGLEKTELAKLLTELTHNTTLLKFLGQYDILKV